MTSVLSIIACSALLYLLGVPIGKYLSLLFAILTLLFGVCYGIGYFTELSTYETYSF